MKMKKYLILALAISMLLTAVCMFTVSAEEEIAAPEIDLKIYAKNLALENSIYVSYAVPVEGTEGADSVKMLFWLTPQSEYTYGTQTYELSPEAATSTIGGKQYYVFEFDKLAAKQMTVDIYARVYATDGENEYYSKLDKYSILQYAYNKLGKTSSSVPTATLKNLLNDMLTYGARAQEHFGTNLDRLATASYYQIKVNNALLSDGADHGLYPVGTLVNTNAPEKNAAGEDFLYWQNSAGEQISDLRTYTITVGNANETYIAVYGIKEATPVEPLIYTKLADGTYSVKANPDVELPASIIIPSTYEGAAVTVIEENAFLDCTGITSILLPEGIKTIGNKAFSGCTGLTELELPETVKTIGTRAFYGCTGLTEITIPASVTSIGTQIFYKCDNLNTVYYNSTYGSKDNLFLNVKSIETVVFGGSRVPNYIAYNNTTLKNVIIQDGVQYVNSYAFYGCTNLASVTIGNSVTSIGNYAFQNCTSLTSITIPDSVTTIGDYAFRDCTSLKKVYYTGTVENWCKISFSNSYSNPMYYGAELYFNNILVTEVEIPDTITKINNYAFWGCTSLTSITIPDSVTSIGYYAFDGCTGLTSITIPESVTSIGEGAFFDCTSLTGITIPDSVTSIGGYAFNSCTSLTSITIPDSVTSIGNEVFAYCTSLTSITIPDSVTSIGRAAFYNCTSLASITIPDSVTSIGDGAFQGCTGLKTVYYTGTVEDWCKISFSDYDSNPTYNGAELYFNNILVTEVEIPDSVTSIGEYAFYGCTSLTGITIPDSVTSIGDYAFNGCTSLASITIPDSVTSIGELAFSGCTSLTNITIPDSVTNIGSSAFAYCSSLTSVTIPDSVTSIGNEAFYGCTSLTSITIPDSVTSIGWSAFEDCTSLKKVYYAGTAEQWEGISINSGNSYLTNATRYYYSETEPTTPGKYWRYVDGVVAVWPAVHLGITIDAAVAPTCATEGLTEGKHCTECGEIIVAQTKIPAFGHAWDDGVVTQEPTLTEAGVKVYTCSNDSTHTYTERIPAENEDFSQPDVWDGTVDTSWFDPNNIQWAYTLTTAEQFAGFIQLRQDGYTKKGVFDGATDKYYFEGVTIKLAVDVILNEGTVEDLKTNGGKQVTALNSNASFKGVFDGQGHTISGVYLDCTSSGMKGLFGGLGDNSVIKNLNIDVAYFNGAEKDKHTGAILAARANGQNILISNVTITNVLMEESTAQFSGVGILLGTVNAGKSITLENCHTAGVISFPTMGINNNAFGGIVGYVDAGTAATDDAAAVETILVMKNCSSEATISATDLAGGLVGKVGEGSQVTLDSDCKFTGTITCEGTSGTYIGNNPEFIPE